MIRQLLIGSVVIAASVAFQAEMFNLLWHRFESVVIFCRRFLRRFANTGAIIAAVLYILMVQSVTVWIWAGGFYMVGPQTALEQALYFGLG